MTTGQILQWFLTGEIAGAIAVLWIFSLVTGGRDDR